jgi:hypothetical protein
MSMTMLVGCGGKENDEGNNNNDKNNNKSTKEVTNLSTSYTKFLEKKEESIDQLQDLIDEYDNFALSLAMLPFVMVDLVIVPASICGLDEEAAMPTLGMLFTNVDYKRNGDKCTVTYDDSNGKKVRFEAEYDSKTDSATISIYDDNDKLSLVSEYSKIKDGYASQYYSYNDDGTTSLFKSIFVGDNIYSSAYEDVNKPVSIFKNNKIDIDFAQDGTTWYIELVDGVSKVLFDGEELNLNIE